MRRAAVGAVVLLVGLAGMRAQAAIPEVISFQGKLADAAGDPVTVATDVEFNLYAADTGGPSLWTETHAGVTPDATGLFSVMLGSVTTFASASVDFTQPLWLGITVGADAEMTPRFELAAAPYAIRAKVADTADTATSAGDADTVDTLHAADLAPAVHTHAAYVAKAGDTMAGTLTLPADGLVAGTDQLVLSGGNVGVGTAAPAEKLSVAGVIESTSGGVKFPDGTTQTTAAKTHQGAIYRWAVFDTYNQAQGWIMGNDASLFGGVAPNVWTDGNGLASQMSADKEVLRTLFTNKGYGGKNAVVISRVHYQCSSTNGRVAVALFRITNSTGAAIDWPVSFHYASWVDQQHASAAVNGSLAFDSGAASGEGSTTLSLSIPGDQTSTVIFVSTGAQPHDTPVGARALVLAFYNDCLQLPAGLSYVDDLDTATGGWEQ